MISKQQIFFSVNSRFRGLTKENNKCFVVLFVPLQLLHQYLMQGFETCNTVQTCIEHVHKGNSIMIQSLLQNYVPLNDIHIVTIFPCLIYIVVFLSPQLLPYFEYIPYLMHSSTVLVSTMPPSVQARLIPLVFAELCPF